MSNKKRKESEELKMKKKNRFGLGSYAAGIAVTGAGVGLVETGLGTGTSMGSSILTGGVKPIIPVANLYGARMTLKHVGKLRIPKPKRKRY